MRYIPALLSALGLCFGLAAVGAVEVDEPDTPAETTRTPGEYATDAAVTAKVKAELAADPIAKAHQIDVETHGGVVQLNGFVDSEENRKAAAQVAANVSGVVEVKNNLEVRGDETAGAIVDDTVITAKVKSALVENDTTKAHEINVESQDGVVQLSGFVDSEAQKSKAAEIARDIEGVTSVRNQIDVKPGS
ncbi:MAG TPA: BON domain-containing protein [Steroidobacteraceae bacterium]|nr:BON domain-containing protein [Steroidobacteraceae bacterium]